MGENPTPTWDDLTNLLFIELSDKQGEQLHKLSERKENKDEYNSSSLFNKLANHHPPPTMGQLTCKLLRNGYVAWRNYLMLFGAHIPRVRYSLGSTLKRKQTYGGPY